MQNQFEFEGQITEVEEPLKNNGQISGHGVHLGQMGFGFQMFFGARVFPEPKVGQTVNVSGKLKRAKNGWPTTQVESVLLIEDVKKADAKGAA